jgi:CRP-like cAMP-binding protein
MDPFTRMREALGRAVHLPAEEWQNFQESLSVKNFRQGQVLIGEGQVENHLHFLSEGATRSFFFKDGKEFTVDFQFAGDFVSAYYSFVTREPSPITIEALTDAEAVHIGYDALQAFYRRFPLGERTGRLMTKHQYAKRLKREMDLLSLTAHERYKELLEKNPALVRDLSVKHLSSYLGIQPESLSRIRKALAGN